MSLVKDTQIVHIGPNSFGGNHKHPRTEWFIAIGPLELTWIDETGEKHTEDMNPSEEHLLLITIPPFLPHVVSNTSDTKSAVLFEYADARQHDVQRVHILK